jgi:hypothetical protein
LLSAEGKNTQFLKRVGGGGGEEGKEEEEEEDS